MPDNYQEEKLRQEILADARTKAERIVARAKNEADRNIARAKEIAAGKRDARLKEVREDTDSKCRSIMLEVARESRRHWLLAREECIEELFAKALKDASATDGEAHAKSMKMLAEEAIAAIGSNDMSVVFPESDAALVTREWLNAIAVEVLGSAPAFTLKPSADARPGLVFATDDGHCTFDNTYASRLAKMKDELRVKVID